MIQEFLLSWELFHNTYLTGWLIGLLLSLVGVLVAAAWVLRRLADR